MELSDPAEKACQERESPPSTRRGVREGSEDGDDGRDEGLWKQEES